MTSNTAYIIWMQVNVRDVLLLTDSLCSSRDAPWALSTGIGGHMSQVGTRTWLAQRIRHTLEIAYRVQNQKCTITGLLQKVLHSTSDSQCDQWQGYKAIFFYIWFVWLMIVMTCVWFRFSVLVLYLVLGHLAVANVGLAASGQADWVHSMWSCSEP